MGLRSVAVGVVIALAMLISGCSSSQQDQYSYDSIQDDAFAQSKYFIDQGYLVDRSALSVKGAEVKSWVALQTEQICEQLKSGTTFDALVQFFTDNFGDVVSDARRFVGNAAGYSCSRYLN